MARDASTSVGELDIVAWACPCQSCIMGGVVVALWGQEGPSSLGGTKRRHFDAASAIDRNPALFDLIRSTHLIWLKLVMLLPLGAKWGTRAQHSCRERDEKY